MGLPDRSRIWSVQYVYGKKLRLQYHRVYFSVLNRDELLPMFSFSPISSVYAAGVITDAPSVSHSLLNILQFLLSIAGILGIIGLVVSGILYFFTAGNEERVALAKRGALMAVTGIVIALGALVLVSQLATFFS